MIYEINTCVWLNELSRKHRRRITIDNVPASEWDDLAERGFDAIWLMGVWERSPAGRAVASQNAALQADFRQVLPDLQPDEIAGSAYCVRRYTADASLASPDGLAIARRNLKARNLRLILDFVPNHVARDHPWVSDHPEYFIRGDSDDLRRDPASFFQNGADIFACGRDPHFPAWPDVLQLDAFYEGLRKAAIDTVTSVARQCDGVRCDMAMLLLNDVFARTWGSRAGKPPTVDYWDAIIPAVKKRFPNFIFIAEAYWDLEWRLQQQGFDFCYDKGLYDRLLSESAPSVGSHLLAAYSYQDRLVRFIENHDEPRAAAVFSPAKHRAAAIVTMTLPGARLLHEGQLEGRKIRVPVFLIRRPDEPVDGELRHFYLRLLAMVNEDVFRNGHWALCERNGWPDNSSFQNLVAWCWTSETDRYLVVVNLSDKSAQGLVKVPWAESGMCRLVDILAEDAYECDGKQMRTEGLFVNLKAWGAHCFHVF